MAEAKTVNVPGIGKVKSVYVYAGIGIFGGIVIYAYWRSMQGAPVAAEEVAEEESTLGTDVPEYVYATDAGYDYGTGMAYPNYTGPNYSGTLPSDTPTSNQTWAQMAREQLGNEGVDSGAASSAIGNYLARLCLSTVQADLVRRAVAMTGNPPQGTFSITPCASEPPTTTPPTTPPSSGPKIAGKVAGLKASRVTSSSITVDWQPAAHSEGYGVYVNGSRRYEPRWSSQTISGLKSKTTYRIGVVPRPDAGYTVPAMTTISVKTK